MTREVSIRKLRKEISDANQKARDLADQVHQLEFPLRKRIAELEQESAKLRTELAYFRDRCRTLTIVLRSIVTALAVPTGASES